ncbi:general transcription factor 3C polypeptide 3 [Diabrotica virgifera virgifera]|uniref:General transcription factor 3C polypeptide 3 n=1 Tax=Diabrotica virgifera virgifera TaxID=50390 RepID=A0ABM5KKK0_DIAVI|nr:general transcription factor 3C polypeptide 3 [Diabrotica virgifera virgifera]
MEEDPGPPTIEEDFYSEDENDQEDGKTKKGSKKDPSKLPAHLKGLMGEANLRYARGDLETAKKMCFEVIRQAPDSYEPYLTLSQMYETTNQKKYKAYLMLASHLAPTSIATTCRLAELCIQDGETEEAIKCYSRSIKYNLTNFFLHKKRLELLEQKCDSKSAIVAKQTMANHIDKKHADIILNLSMEVAKEHYKNKSYIRAIEVLKIPIKRIPEKVTQDVVNVMLELLLINERYSDCLDMFTQFCGFTFDLYLTDDNSIVMNSYEVPENLPIDLKIKFIVCLVKLRCENLFSPLLDKMLIEMDVETCGDLYLDVVEALMTVGYFMGALKLLVPLVKSKNYSLAAVWLKYAECLASCDMIEQAIDSYYTVKELAPGHVEVLYPLAMLLLKQNQREEALKVMSQDFSANKLDVAVLLEQMKLLKQINNWESYWKCMELLMSRHCPVLKHPEELKILLTKERPPEKLAKLRKMRNFRNDSTSVESNFTVIKELSLEEDYDIYKNILQLSIDRREYCYLQKFTFMGLASKRFQKYFSEVNIMAAFSCLLTNDCFHGYNLLRETLMRYSNNNLAWNWFGIVTATQEELRFARFLERFGGSLPIDNRRIIIANHHLSMGNYINTINFYLKRYKQTNSVFAAFMLAVAMLQHYHHKSLDKAKKQSMAEIVSYLFLNYAKQRNKMAEQEVYYNLGRMYHQLGVMYLAEFYYKKVFKVDNSYLEQYPEIVSLKREAAFNLHIIYKNSENFIAARNILYEHIVI